MELPVSMQAGEFLTAVLLGVGLGLCYDLMRGPRNLVKKLTWLMDLFFCGVFFYSLLWLWLVACEGLIRGYCFLGMGLGMTLWFLTLSSFVLRIWVAILRFVCVPAAKILKILRKIVKNGARG